MIENQPPRVLHICKVYQPIKGGIQRVVHITATLLSRFSHTVITTGRDGAISNEIRDDVEVCRYRSYGEIASMPIALSLIAGILRRAKQVQLIVVHYPFPLADLALLFVFRSPPIVVHWHSEIIAQRKLKWLVLPFTWLMLLRAKAIVVTSERMLEQSSLLSQFRQKIVFIPYGLASVKVESVPPAVGLEKEYFLMVGRHVSYKGIDVAIRAMQNITIPLVIAGDGPLYEQHERLVSELGLAKKIRFERHLNDVDVTNLLDSCTALLVPSVRENEAFALVQLEAMRLGKAVINTALESSVPWVARHQKEALTVPPGDVAALTDALQILSADPTLAKQLGANGLIRFNDLFTAERFSTLLDKLYMELLLSKKSQVVT